MPTSSRPATTATTRLVLSAQRRFIRSRGVLASTQVCFTRAIQSHADLVHLLFMSAPLFSSIAGAGEFPAAGLHIHTTPQKRSCAQSLIGDAGATRSMDAAYERPL